MALSASDLAPSPGLHEPTRNGRRAGARIVGSRPQVHDLGPVFERQGAFHMSFDSAAILVAVLPTIGSMASPAHARLATAMLPTNVLTCIGLGGEAGSKTFDLTCIQRDGNVTFQLSPLRTDMPIRSAAAKVGMTENWQAASEAAEAA